MASDYWRSTEEEMVRETMQALLIKSPPDQPRRQAVRAHWKALGASGLIALAEPNEHGSLFVAAAEEAGFATAWLPWASAVLVTSLFSRNLDVESAGLLIALQAGDAIVAPLVDPEGGGNFIATPSSEGWTVSGEAPLAEAAAIATHFLVDAGFEGGGRVLLCVESESDGLSICPADVVDEGLDADVTMHNCRARVVWTEWDAPRVESALRAMQAARVALAAGAMRKLVELTTAHSSIRQQFGQSLAGFQGVRHLLAEMAQATAEVDGAAHLLSSSPTGHNETAARLLATRQTDLVWRNAVQLHGGLGMTAESPIRTHVRRLIGLGLRMGQEDALVELASCHFDKVQPFGILGNHAPSAIRRVREEARALIETKLEPWMQDVDRKMTGFFAAPAATKSWHAALSSNGYSAPGWPAEAGGTGWTPAQRYIFQLEVERAEAPHINQMGVRMVGPVLMKYGTEEQKARFLPLILKGQALWCQGFSEPNSGSDLASLRTRAVREGENYFINGSKIWTTHAQHADWMFALVRTSTDGRKQDGISFLLIDMHSPGLTIRPIMGLDGDVDLNEVFFDDVVVPVGNLVGDENRGWEVAKSLLELERGGGLAAPELRARFERLRPPAGGAALVKWATTGAELAVLEMMELMMLTDRAFYAVPGGTNSIIKLAYARVRQALGRLVVESKGREALRFDMPIRRMIADKAHSIFGGAAEIQKDIIAKEMARGI